MFLNTLKRHAPVLAFVLVTTLCIALASSYRTRIEDDPQIQSANQDLHKIQAALSTGRISVGYESGLLRNKIGSLETFKQSVERSARTADEPIGVNYSYPQPARINSESVDRRGVPPIPDYAVLPNLKTGDKEFYALADHCKIYIHCELPAKEEYRFMVPIRIEIFRSLDKENFDTSKPLGSIELGSEKPRIGEKRIDPETKPVPPAGRRRNGGAPGPSPLFELPATERVFRDAKSLVPFTQYYYCARLVARFTSKVGHLERDPITNEFKSHQLPNDMNVTAVRSQDTASSALLFATELTKVVGAKTQCNFDLRVSGIEGQDKIPPFDAILPPNRPLNRSYSIHFEVRYLSPETNKFETAAIQGVHEGEMLSGKIKDHDFTSELGCKLIEVKNVEVSSIVKDQKEIKPAIMIENLKSKSLETLFVSPKFNTGRSIFGMYDQIIEAQDREMAKIRQANAIQK